MNKRVIIAIMIMIILSFQSTYADEDLQYIEEDDDISSEMSDEELLQYEEFLEKSKKQAAAIEAYRTLEKALFTISEDGWLVYPDDFCGAWLCDDILYIATVKGTDNTEYKDVLSQYSCVKFVEYKYSYNVLNEIKEYIYNEIKDEINIVEYCVDQKQNAILYYTIDDIQTAEELIETYVENNQNAVSGQFNVDIKDLCIQIKKGNPIEEEANLIGGRRIRKGSGSGASRSIGICGQINMNGSTYNGFVTAGHGLSISGTNSKLYKSGSTTQLGEVMTMTYGDNYPGDYALVHVTSSDTLTNKVYYTSTGTSKMIKGYQYDVIQGTALMKYGYKSQLTYATVEQQNVTDVVNNTSITGLTKCLVTAGTSDDGDSGGPYYNLDFFGDYSFIGVHRGSQTDSNGAMHILFTPYCRFQYYFTPKTN